MQFTQFAILVLLFNCLINVKAQTWYDQPCEDYACDSANLQNILDRNNLRIPLELIAATVRNGRITKLHFKYDKIRNLYEPIGNLTELDTIIFDYTNNHYIASEIKNCTKLKYIRFNECFDMDSLLPEIGELPNLTHFELTACTSFYRFPNTINKWNSIQSIKVSNTKLASMPSTISSLSTLKGLEWSNSLVESLPESIMQLAGLENVNIRNNRLCDSSSSVNSWLTGFDSLWAKFQDCTSSQVIAMANRNTGSSIHVNFIENNLIIRSQINGPMEISIQDLQGRNVISKRIRYSQCQISLDSFPHGVFIYKIKLPDYFIQGIFSVIH